MQRGLGRVRRTVPQHHHRRSLLPEQDSTVGPAETAWARTFLDALQPHRAGAYVNFLDSDDDTNRVHEAYGDETYRPLAEVNAKYDSENVFHINKNIQPGRPPQGAPASGVTSRGDSASSPATP
jgi:hypothetical protein